MKCCNEFVTAVTQTSAMKIQGKLSASKSLNIHACSVACFLQAMGKEGKLVIEAFPSDDNMKVNVHICDSGPGIMESARNKVFNLFYSTKITGTGLGLPISKSIIEANEGELYLEETGEEGSESAS